MKQADLARLLTKELGRSIDRAAVNKMAAGKRKMSADELVAIAKLTKQEAPLDSLATQEVEGAKRLPDRKAALTIDPDDLRKIVALLLRAQGTEDQLAADLADTVVECLAAPPLAALKGDVVRSFEVRFELQAQQSEQLGSR